MASTVHSTSEITSKLLDASDRLSTLGDLVEAIFLAASGLSDRQHASAIQAVCDLADDRVEAVKEILEDLRSGIN